MTDGGLWWMCRVTRFGAPSANGLVWTRQMGPVLAEALCNAPVRCCPMAGQFVHPPPHRDRDPVDLEFLVGLVDSAWATRDSVLATIRLTLDGRGPVLRHGLLRMERDGVLERSIGLSIVGRLDTLPYVSGRRSVRHVTAIRYILAVDLVTAPASPGSALLRSTTLPLERSTA